MSSWRPKSTKTTSPATTNRRHASQRSRRGAGRCAAAGAGHAPARLQSTPCPYSPAARSAQASSAAERRARTRAHGARADRRARRARPARPRRHGRDPSPRFVPAEQRALAYRDHPLPIGGGQTISQRTFVALMSECSTSAATSACWRSNRIGYQAGGDLAPGRRPCTRSRSTRSSPRPAAARLARLDTTTCRSRRATGSSAARRGAFDAIISPPRRRASPTLLAQLREGGPRGRAGRAPRRAGARARNQTRRPTETKRKGECDSFLTGEIEKKANVNHRGTELQRKKISLIQNLF